MLQQTLFAIRPRDPDICRNRHRGADTSVLAHARVQKQRDRDEVLSILRREPATLDEVARRLDRQVNTISGRFTELKKAGQIIDTGERKPTRTGSLARIYRARAG